MNRESVEAEEGESAVDEEREQTGAEKGHEQESAARDEPFLANRKSARPAITAAT